MTDLEKTAVKKFVKDMLEEHLPQFAEAELVKVPEAYQPILKAIGASMWPVAKTYIESKLEAL